jgi:hypothetical protein
MTTQLNIVLLKQEFQAQLDVAWTPSAADLGIGRLEIAEEECQYLPK